MPVDSLLQGVQFLKASLAQSRPPVPNVLVSHSDDRHYLALRAPGAEVYFRLAVGGIGTEFDGFRLDDAVSTKIEVRDRLAAVHDTHYRSSLAQIAGAAVMHRSTLIFGMMTRIVSEKVGELGINAELSEEYYYVCCADPLAGSLD